MRKHLHGMDETLFHPRCGSARRICHFAHQHDLALEAAGRSRSIEHTCSRERWECSCAVAGHLPARAQHDSCIGGNIQPAQAQALRRIQRTKVIQAQVQAVLYRQQRQGRHPDAVVAKQQGNLAHTAVVVGLCVHMPHSRRHRSQRRDGVLRGLQRGGSRTRVGCRAAAHVRGQRGSSTHIFIPRGQKHIARPLDGRRQKRISVQRGFCLSHHAAQFGCQRGCFCRS